MGLASGKPSQGSVYRPSRLDLVEFIRQCDPHKVSSQDDAWVTLVDLSLSCPLMTGPKLQSCWFTRNTICNRGYFIELLKQKI